MILSRYQDNGRALPWIVGQMNDGWLLMEYSKDLNNIEHDNLEREKFFL